jgi:hypothetical protein
VTVADPPVAVIVFTTVIWQIRPRPPVLSTPLLQAVVAAIVAAGLTDAATGAVVNIAAGARSDRAKTPRSTKVSGRFMGSPASNQTRRTELPRLES